MMDLLWAAAIVGAVAVGLFFTLVSTVGVIRLPDVYARAHTASQADTLGAGFALAGVALYLGWQPVSVKTVLLLFFIFVTNPTAAHAIARAAHEEGIVPWTVDDDREDADLAKAGRSEPSHSSDDRDDRSAAGVTDAGSVADDGSVADGGSLADGGSVGDGGRVVGGGSVADAGAANDVGSSASTSTDAEGSSVGSTDAGGEDA